MYFRPRIRPLNGESDAPFKRLSFAFEYLFPFCHFALLQPQIAAVILRQWLMRYVLTPCVYGKFLNAKLTAVHPWSSHRKADEGANMQPLAMDGSYTVCLLLAR